MPYTFVHLLSNTAELLLRRVYLPYFITSSPFNPQGCPPRTADPALLDFWQTATVELFASCRQTLHIASNYSENGGRLNFSPLMVRSR